MTDTKHTAGPWRISNYSSRRIISDKNDIASTTIIVSTDPSSTIDEAESYANARLIASAPAQQAEIDQLKAEAKQRLENNVLTEVEQQVRIEKLEKLGIKFGNEIAALIAENETLTAKVERLRGVAHRTSNIIQAAIKGFGDYVPFGIAGDKLTAMFTTCRNAAYDLRAILAETEPKTEETKP